MSKILIFSIIILLYSSLLLSTPNTYLYDDYEKLTEKNGPLRLMFDVSGISSSPLCFIYGICGLFDPDDEHGPMFYAFSPLLVPIGSCFYLITHNTYALYDILLLGFGEREYPNILCPMYIRLIDFAIDQKERREKNNIHEEECVFEKNEK